MSQETIEDLNTQVLVGYTDKRGHAWHYREDVQGVEPNHYPGAIPREDVHRRLFSWEAIEAPLAVTLADGRVATDSTRKVIVRDDNATVLGVFKSGYQIHQYGEWLVDNVETLLDADVAIGSAGLLKGGAMAWVQVEMEETCEVAGVSFRPFLTAATSMDGSLASTYQSGAQVVVCDNTLSAALKDRTHQVKIRHSKNSLGRVTDVRDTLGIIHQVADDFAAQIEALTAREVSDAQWRAFTEAYTGLDKDLEAGHALTIAERRQGELNSLWNADERVKPWAGTAYGVVQAVNTHVHHMSTIRGTDRASRNMERMIRGDWDKVDGDTLTLLDKVLTAA